ncbi:MAG: response regulator [Ignavibacteriaceae bacterium]|nr:response regulator [Ignavibacteriaceae bacterium]
MTSSIFTKYSPEVLLGNFSPLAITDEKLKIIWYNNSFKEIFKLARLKGKSLKELFSFADYTDEIKDFYIEQTSYSLPALNKQIQITPLYGDEKKKTVKGYKLEILPVFEQTSSRNENEILRKHYVDFQNELQDILMMMVKENSIDNLSEAILLKSIKSGDGDFGLIVFLNDSPGTKFKYSDPNDIITNKSEVEKTIQTDFKFITKWLEINKHSLTALNQSDNLGYNICSITGCHSILISPCFFDNKLIATLLVGKTKSNFTLESISLIEQFATMLAFAISNITTRELNTALENRLLQAQKLETIGKLSSGMAHDFGNLLSSIFGSVNLLRKRVDQSESVQKLIDNIENCSVRARDLTKGLLSFGKPTPKRKELVKPHQLLGEIIKIITQTFPKTISLKEDIEENLYDLVGNSTEIYQVLLNLCVNAKEATEGKGTIGISAKNITIDNKNHSYFPLLSQGNYVRFSIEDNGVGIEEKNLTKIFDPYFSTKSKDTGSGLGLYVSYGIIKAHKGFIDVSSKPGVGTTFDVYIPAFELPKEKKPEPTEKIILLADDEPMLGDLLAELLEMNGYSVIKVSSGKEVLKLLTEEIKVDLAIIDYNMPEMSGLDTIAEIKKLNLNIPIILSSGSMWVENELDLSEYNISSQVQKPYEFETMLATIQKLI